MKVYVAGPMRGIPDFNFPAFNDATEKLRALGHTVFSPAEKDVQKHGAEKMKSATGDLSDLARNESGFSLRETLLVDLAWIAGNADAVVVLPGWENSKGAAAEVALARAINLPEHPCAVLTLEDVLGVSVGEGRLAYGPTVVQAG